jgi:hypothetical protein
MGDIVLNEATSPATTGGGSHKNSQASSPWHNEEDEAGVGVEYMVPAEEAMPGCLLSTPNLQLSPALPSPPLSTRLAL